MPTHYHFLVQSEARVQASKFVQTTFNAYSQAFNKQEQRSGTLFESRAKFKQIKTDVYVLQLSRYIHLNPVEAGMVSRPEDWDFSNYQMCIAKQDSNRTGNHGFLLDYFTNPIQYKEFVEATLAKASAK
jgi:hypothetical protein